MLVYVNNFYLDGAEQEERAFNSVSGWLQKITGLRLSAADLKSGGEYREGVYAVRTYAADKREPALYSALLTHRDANQSGRSWATEISIRREEKGVFVSVLLETQEQSTQVDDSPEATRPVLINYLADNCAFATNTAGRRVKILRGGAGEEDEYQSLRYEIERETRNYPLVLVSCAEGAPLLDAEKLQRQLFGLAQVVFIENSCNSRNMERILGRNYSAWDGAVNIIYPYVARKGFCYTNLLRKSELQGLEESGKYLPHYILSLITHRTNLIKKQRHFSPVDVRAKRQKDYLLNLRENSAVEGKNDKEQVEEYRQLFEAAREENQEMQGQIDQLKMEKAAAEEDSLRYMQEKEDAEKQLKAKEYQIASLSSKTQPEKNLTDITEAVMVLAGERKLTPKLCLELAAQKTGKIVILDSALKSAEGAADYQNSDNLLAALVKLGDEFLPAYLEGGDNKTDSIFTRDTYAAKESPQTMNNPKCKQARTFSYDGREITMWQHLGWGKANNTREALRLYFYVDQDAEKIVIGHCGAHLDTINTSRI